jgi:hypothetical protein
MRAFDRDLIRAGSNVGRGLQRGRIIMQVVRIGLDLAKYVFEVHGVDVVIRKTLRRGSVATFFANLPTKPEQLRIPRPAFAIAPQTPAQQSRN